MGFADQKNAAVMGALEALYASERNDAASLQFVEKNAGGGSGYLPGRQDVRYGPHTVVIPAAYLENTWAYQHLIALAQNDAAVILFVADSQYGQGGSAPGLTTAFTCPVVGVIVDDASSDKGSAEEFLRDKGVKAPYCRVDLTSGQGFSELFARIVPNKGMDGNEERRCSA